MMLKKNSFLLVCSVLAVFTLVCAPTLFAAMDEVVSNDTLEVLGKWHGSRRVNGEQLLFTS